MDLGADASNCAPPYLEKDTTGMISPSFRASALRTVVAATICASSLSFNLTPAFAGTDCGNGNNYSNNGNADPSCGGGGDDTDPAPLPLSGIPTLLALAAGAGVIVMRRRHAVAA
jgi:hypothetical protein